MGAHSRPKRPHPSGPPSIPQAIRATGRPRWQTFARRPSAPSRVRPARLHAPTPQPSQVQEGSLSEPPAKREGPARSSVRGLRSSKCLLVCRSNVWSGRVEPPGHPRRKGSGLWNRLPVNGRSISVTCCRFQLHLGQGGACGGAGAPWLGSRLPRPPGPGRQAPERSRIKPGSEKPSSTESSSLAFIVHSHGFSAYENDAEEMSWLSLSRKAYSTASAIAT
jgi:hypothetical protein